MSGLLAAGWVPAEISLCVRQQERADQLAAETGCTTSIKPDEAAVGCDVVVVAVKPIGVPAVIESLKGSIEESQTLVSIVAGVTTASYESRLGRVAVVRAMPNTPALVRQGVTGMAAGEHAGNHNLEVATVVLEAVGSVRIMDEHLLDAVTAVSGTGPAYVFLLAEAMIEAGMAEGLPRDLAESFVDQTIRGAGYLLTDTSKTPVELRYEVTSPGGTTASAMHVLEEGGFRTLVMDAVRAAAERATELGHGEAG